jgi:hypothetical protein
VSRRRLVIGVVLLVAAAGCAVAVAAAIGVTSATLGIGTKTLSSEQTCTLSSAEDAQISAGSPNSTNSDPSLITIYHQSDGVNTTDGFIKFSFGSCNFPANAVVDSATLRLTVQATTSMQLGLYRVASSWSGSSITWNNAPSASSSPTTTVTFNSSQKTLDVSTDVADYVDGDATNGGWKIAPISGNNQTPICGASYGNSSWRPVLTIKYVY